MREYGTLSFLEGSWIVERFRHLLQRVPVDLWTQACVHSFRGSLLPACGKILIAGLLTNGFLLWILGKEISPLACGGRVVLLFLACAAQKGTGDWNAIRQGSFFLR